LPNSEHVSARELLLAGKPLIPTKSVEACIGDPHSGSTLTARGYDFEYRTCSNQFEMLRANDVDLIFVSPQPKAEALSIVYPPEYVPFQFHEMRGPARAARDFVQEKKARAILALAGPNGKILDVGTGSGMLLRQIARVKGNRENLYANDFSETILAPLRHEGFQTIVGQAEHLELAERFDVIVLNQVLEHLENPVVVVMRLSRLLAHGGFLFVETPSIDGIDAKLFRKRYWGGYHIPRHFWLFNESSLTMLMKTARLGVHTTQYLASPAFWIQSLHHMLLDHGWFRAARFFSEKNPLLLVPFTAFDLTLIVLGGRTSNIRIVAKKTAPDIVEDA
jgi:2-polyprenyl-3-methyl-5-hydroxy-6-metoxy-1,4-benzoquinol methylase